MMEISGLFADYYHVIKSTMIYLSIILDKADYRCLSRRQGISGRMYRASFFILPMQMSEISLSHA